MPLSAITRGLPAPPPTAPPTPVAVRPQSLGAPAATLHVGHKPRQPPAEQLARHLLAAEGCGAPLRPPLAPPLRAAKGAPPSALSPSPPGELQGGGQLRSPHVTEDHGGPAPIPPLACRPSQAGGHRYPEVITAGGSKAGVRLAPLSRVAPVVVGEGAVPKPQFSARQDWSLVGRGRVGRGVGCLCAFMLPIPKPLAPYM